MLVPLQQLRQNLDPLGQHDDADIWSALRAVQLEDEVRVMGVSIESTKVMVVRRDLPSLREAGEGQSALSLLFAPKPFSEQEHPLSVLERARSTSPAPSSAGGGVMGRVASSESMAPLSEQEHPLSVIERADSGVSSMLRNPSSCDLNEYDHQHPHGRHHKGACVCGVVVAVRRHSTTVLFSQPTHMYK